MRGFQLDPGRLLPGQGSIGSAYERRIADALDANANLLRVWGGGIYESDDFYEICDRRGMLVWQDFLFACAAYPGELAVEVEAEARDAIDRLMSHPSLIIWNGNNENLWGWWDWGWQPEVGDREWGPLFYRQILPELVTALDPARPYIDGSPTSLRAEIHPNDPNHGPTHIWDVWNERDYTHYRTYRPRFVAEFGFQAPANHATLARAISSRPLSPGDATMSHHQKAITGWPSWTVPSTPIRGNRRASNAGSTSLNSSRRRRCERGSATSAASTTGAPESSGGSSMTAGRHSRGPLSIAMGGASWRGTPPGRPSPTAT